MKKLFIKLLIKLQKRLVADGKKCRIAKVYINNNTGEVVALKSKVALWLYSMVDGLIFKSWEYKFWEFDSYLFNALAE